MLLFIIKGLKIYPRVTQNVTPEVFQIIFVSKVKWGLKKDLYPLFKKTSFDFFVLNDYSNIYIFYNFF